MKEDEQRPDGRLWGASRAAAVARYAAVEDPTREQAEAAARELGVSLRRLNSLVRAWRIHGRTSMRMGHLKNDPEAIADAISAAEGPLDLRGIKADSRAEVERRVRIIGRFLRAGKVDRSEAEAYATEYGRELPHFRTAVTAWLISRDPAKLPGLAYMSSRRTRGPNFDPAVDALIGEAIDRLGLDAAVDAVLRLSAQLAHAAGLAPPARLAVNRRLLKARAEPRPSVLDGALRLDRLALRDGPDDPLLVLSLLFGASSGAIHAHRLEAAPPSARSDAILIEAHLRLGIRSGDAALLEFDAPPGREWGDLLTLLEEVGVNCWSSSRRPSPWGHLARLTFGARIEGLDLRRLDAWALRRLDRSGEVRSDVFGKVADAIARHNEARTHVVPPLLLPAERAGEAADRLSAAFAGGLRPTAHPPRHGSRQAPATNGQD